MSGNRTKCKVLLITGRSDQGGGPKHVHDLALGLINLGHDIFIASPFSDPYGEKFQSLGKKHFFIPHRRFNFLSLFKLLFFIFQNNIEFIHSHGRAAGIYSRLLKFFRFNIIHTFHGVHNEKSLAGYLKLKIDQVLAPLTDYFISVSQSEKQKALDLHVASNKRIVIIPNGINEEEILKQSPLNLREKYELPADKKIWGTLTRLSPEKGNHLLINEVINNPSLKNYIFLIAGDGPKYEELQEEITSKKLNNIKLLGNINNPIAFLKGLDGYFSFSYGEGLPYSVLEALACRVPCLLSNVSGHTDFKSVATLFDILKQSDFNLKMNQIILDYEWKNYSVDEMARDIENVYKKL